MTMFEKLKSKKFLVIGIVVLGFTIFGVVFFIVSQKEKQTKIPEAKINEPKISSNIRTYEGKIKINLNKSQYKIPKEMLVYRLNTNPLDINEATKIANNLSFVEEPLLANDILKGRVLIWDEDVGFLRIIPTLRIIDYQSNSVSTTTIFQNFASENELVTTAKEFLVQKNLYSTQNLSFKKAVYINPGYEGFSITNKDSASLVELSFREKIDNYDIVSDDESIASIRVTLNRNSEVYSLYVDGINQSIPTIFYPIKNFDEFKASLGEARLQIISEGKIGLVKLCNIKIDQIIVNNIDIAYLQESSGTQTTLQPILVLESSIDFQGQNGVPATLFMPAISQEFLNN